MPKKYIPEGSWLACNKGTCPSSFRISHNNKTYIYGHKLASEADKIPFFNIKPMGICSVKRSMCIPTVREWDNWQDGVRVNGHHLLKEDSTCQCLFGGKIKIYFDRGKAAADCIAGAIKMPTEYIKEGFDRTAEQNAKQREAIDSMLPDWMKSGTHVVYWYQDNFTGVVEGTVSGLVGIPETIYQIVQDPVGTAEAIAGMAGKGYDAAKEGAANAKEWVSDGDNWRNAYNSTKDRVSDSKFWKDSANSAWESTKEAGEWVAKHPRATGTATGQVAAAVLTVGGSAGATAARVVKGTAEIAEVAVARGAEGTIARIAAEEAAAKKATEEAAAARKAGEAVHLGEEALIRQGEEVAGVVVVKSKEELLEVGKAVLRNWEKEAKALDDAGGHSYKDHGAHTTEAQHAERLRTGKTPSGERISPTETSGKFNSNEEHIKAYEDSQAKLQTKKTNSKGKLKKGVELRDEPFNGGTSYSLDANGNVVSTPTTKYYAYYRLDPETKTYKLVTLYPKP